VTDGIEQNHCQSSTGSSNERRPLDQVQNPQHHNHSLLRDQPEHVLGDVLLHTSQLSLAIPL